MASFHLTHEVLVQLYELLILTPPFNRWGLPKPEAIIFEATTIDRPGRHGSQGSYLYDEGKHIIRVNPERHKTVASAFATLAHEVNHMHVKLQGHRYWQTHAGPFAKGAKQICRAHSLDYGQF